ncbi:hypothetical protein NQZ68_014868 [Dissostichus eleginoides]|nr:hypothetical protein NQZ68_014868 [Dissostichus eleginoides]
MDSIISVFGSYVVWDVNSLLLFSVIFILTADYFKNRQPGSFPPGPRAFPIVGNIFTLDYSRNHEFMTELAGKYGDVYSLRMGQAWVVVLNRLEVLKEALVNQKDSLVDGRRLLFSNGNLWKQQRRFALSTLRNFGFDKRSIEAVILDEFTYCAKVFKSYEGKPFNPHLFINNAVSNIICSLVFGYRFEYSNKKFIQLMELFGKSLQIQASIWAQLFNSFPRLMRRLPGPHQTVQHMLNDVKDFIRVEIKKHKQNWDPSDPRDYIDCFLNEIQMGKVQAEDAFHDENLVMCVMDLFVAGSETTSTTLHWGFLYMAKYPEMQVNKPKVQSEIDRVIGESRQPSMEDRPNMPYTDAVIHEIQRMGNLGGYTIQKGVTIIPNLTSALYDKNEWETADTFNPGHFLNKEGKFVKRAAFIPFSAGKRLCPGESLAKMELFLFFVSFMQRFTFSTPAGVKPEMDFQYGVTLCPRSHELCATSH